MPASAENIRRAKQAYKREMNSVKAGLHYGISINISRHTQKQYVTHDERLYSYVNFQTKDAS